MLVYVPARPAAPAPPASNTPKVLVIAPPAAPPETEPKPEESQALQASGPAASRQRRNPSHTAAPAEPDQTTTQDIPVPPAAEVPALESQESSAQENELRQRYVKLAEDIQQRLARLNASRFSGEDQRTLEDARSFYLQSAHAMATGDLPRALNLAQKSDLLLAALE